MAIEIKPETVKEIAELLDAGMVCFYHKTNHELEYYPDEFRNPGFDAEVWAEIIDKVEENYGDFMRFKGMDSSEAFRVMESFISDIDHIPTHNKLISAISGKKPFAHFNDLLVDYPRLRQQWFAYKLDIYIAFVKEQVECE